MELITYQGVPKGSTNAGVAELFPTEVWGMSVVEGVEQKERSPFNWKNREGAVITMLSHRYS